MLAVLLDELAEPYLPEMEISPSKFNKSILSIFRWNYRGQCYLKVDIEPRVPYRDLGLGLTIDHLRRYEYEEPTLIESKLNLEQDGRILVAHFRSRGTFVYSGIDKSGEYKRAYPSGYLSIVALGK